MKTLLTITLSALITWAACSFYFAINETIKKTHHFSSSTRPLQISLDEIEFDLKEGRKELALKKIEALNERVQDFDVDIEENHLSPIIIQYRELDAEESKKSDPDEAGQ